MEALMLSNCYCQMLNNCKLIFVFRKTPVNTPHSTVLACLKARKLLKQSSNMPNFMASISKQQINMEWLHCITHAFMDTWKLSSTWFSIAKIMGLMWWFHVIEERLLCNMPPMFMTISGLPMCFIKTRFWFIRIVALLTNTNGFEINVDLPK